MGPANKRGHTELEGGGSANPSSPKLNIDEISREEELDDGQAKLLRAFSRVQDHSEQRLTRRIDSVEGKVDAGAARLDQLESFQKRLLNGELRIPGTSSAASVRSNLSTTLASVSEEAFVPTKFRRTVCVGGYAYGDTKVYAAELEGNLRSEGVDGVESSNGIGAFGDKVKIRFTSSSKMWLMLTKMKGRHFASSHVSEDRKEDQKPWVWHGIDRT